MRIPDVMKWSLLYNKNDIEIVNKFHSSYCRFCVERQSGFVLNIMQL